MYRYRGYRADNAIQEGYKATDTATTIAIVYLPPIFTVTTIPSNQSQLPPYLYSLGIYR